MLNGIHEAVSGNGNHSLDSGLQPKSVKTKMAPDTFPIVVHSMGYANGYTPQVAVTLSNGSRGYQGSAQMDWMTHQVLLEIAILEAYCRATGRHHDIVDVELEDMPVSQLGSTGIVQQVQNGDSRIHLRAVFSSRYDAGMPHAEHDGA